ncbi:MAG: Phosphoribosyl transferase domain, partial [Chloroflexota bacterium]
QGLPIIGTVILVDDVMTTGATLDQAARACLAAGCTDVCAVTLAREP